MFFVNILSGFCTKQLSSREIEMGVKGSQVCIVKTIATSWSPFLSWKEKKIVTGSSVKLLTLSLQYGNASKKENRIRHDTSVNYIYKYIQIKMC